MKILFIASYINPFHPTNGSIQRTSLLLKACTKIAETDLLIFNGVETRENDFGVHIIMRNGDFPRPSATRWEKLMKLIKGYHPQYCYPKSLLMEREVDKVIAKKNYDLIVVRYMSNAAMFGVMKYANRLVIDVDDSPVESALMDAQNAKTLRNKLYHRLFAKQVKIALKTMVTNNFHTFFSNPLQACWKNTSFLPNVPYYAINNMLNEDAQITRRILFVGEMRYTPNKNGIDHFLNKIYPHIQEKYKDTTLHIVGRVNDAEREKWNAVSGVTVCGFVPDLMVEYEQAQVVAIPIYEGAGTCIKLLEALQVGRACVTTPIGARGYENVFESGKDFIIAETDEEFYSAVEELFGNKFTRIALTHHATKIITERYSHAAFDAVVQKALKK